MSIPTKIEVHFHVLPEREYDTPVGPIRRPLERISTQYFGISMGFLDEVGAEAEKLARIHGRDVMSYHVDGDSIMGACA